MDISIVASFPKAKAFESEQMMNSVCLECRHDDLSRSNHLIINNKGEDKEITEISAQTSLSCLPTSGIPISDLLFARDKEFSSINIHWEALGNNSIEVLCGRQMEEEIVFQGLCLDARGAAPRRRDRGRGSPLARSLVRPRGRARRQPGKTKQTRTQLSPLPRPRPPSAPGLSSAAAASCGASAGPRRCRGCAGPVTRAAAGRGLFPAWGGLGDPPHDGASRPLRGANLPPPPALAPRRPGRARRGSPRVFVGSAVGKPRSSAPSLAPGPGSGGTSPPALPLRPLPVSLSLSAAGPRPVRAARGPIVSRAGPGDPCGSWGAAAGAALCAVGASRSGSGTRGTPGAPRPSASQTGSFLCPNEPPGGRGQGKFAPKFLIYSKAWRRRVIFFFFSSSAYTQCVSQVSSHSFPFTGFDCLTACVFVSSLLNNCSFTPLSVFVSVSRGGCRRKVAGGVGVRETDMGLFF
ncbi:translation initiation factor IF-2-like [Mirounga leonina]|uniref:translation initiation factor IF-2-like n=1 Tax=Mirounga leonina TaxID=9715 RepID=UPI00156C22FC|nr:translation initiation factor IF-2-like [Mirounga leonina]